MAEYDYQGNPRDEAHIPTRYVGMLLLLQVRPGEHTFLSPYAPTPRIRRGCAVKRLSKDARPQRAR